MTDGAANNTAFPNRPWLAPALEVLVAFGTAALFLATCAFIRVYPIDRLGQISGLASLALRFFLFGLAWIVLLVWMLRKARGFDMTARLACAAVAGMTGGLLGGGIMVALHGTPWGLNALGGDAGVLVGRAVALQRGEPLPPLYPPLSLHVLASYADVMNLTPAFAMKQLQILGTAAFGPVAYLSWRFLLRPQWALGIGVIAMLPLVEPYKPFANLVLVAFVPLAILYLDTLRKIAARPTLQIVQMSIGFGAVFALMFLTYSGWFQWAAPGLLVATLVMFPWREAPRKALLLLAITGVVFALVAGRYLLGLLDPAAKVVDDYVYFDVKVEPMYVAMWRGDSPGLVGPWPPPGELGGVGLFTIALLFGFGLAIALGRRTTAIITLASVMIGAWLMRFMYARLLWETKLVQLYPRTTPLITYCLLAMTGYAVFWLIQRLPSESPIRGRSGVLGALCALMILFVSAGSATADRYMPADTDPKGTNNFAYNAFLTKWGHVKRPYRAKVLPWVRRPKIVETAPSER